MTKIEKINKSVNINLLLSNKNNNSDKQNNTFNELLNKKKQKIRKK